MSNADVSSAVAVVEAAFRTIASEGLDQLLTRYPEFFDNEFEWQPALVGSLVGAKTYRGLEGFSEYLRDFTDSFAEVEFEDTSFEALGDSRVLVTAVLHLRGAGGGVPLDRKVAYLFELRNDRIISGRTFFSPADALGFLADA